MMVVSLLSGLTSVVACGEVIPVDLTGYRPECGIGVRHEGDRLTIDWPMDRGEHGRLALDLREGRPLGASLGIASDASGSATAILGGVEPVTFVTVGSRVTPPGRPPTMSPFNVFFDTPAK